MSQNNNEIEIRFGTSVSEEDLARYNDLRRQRSLVSGFLFFVFIVILSAISYISLRGVGSERLFFGLLGALLVLMIVGRWVQRPFYNRMEDTGVDRKTLLQHELDSAADAYNENDYKKVFEHLENIDSEIHSNSNYLMGRDQDIQTYIRQIRKSDNRESEIRSTFPRIVRILISEQVNKQENTEELNTILYRLQNDETGYDSPPIILIYKEDIQRFLTREKIGIMIVSAYFIGVIAVFFAWDQELAGVLAALGVAVGLLLNILGIVD